MKTTILALTAALALSAFAAHANEDVAGKKKAYTCYVTDSTGAEYKGRRQIFDRTKSQVQYRVFKACRVNSVDPASCTPRGCINDKD